MASGRTTFAASRTEAELTFLYQEIVSRCDHCAGSHQRCSGHPFTCMAVRCSTLRQDCVEYAAEICCRNAEVTACDRSSDCDGFCNVVMAGLWRPFYGK